MTSFLNMLEMLKVIRVPIHVGYVPLSVCILYDLDGASLTVVFRFNSLTVGDAFLDGVWQPIITFVFGF